MDTQHISDTAGRIDVVIYHTDMDGWASAWVVKEWLKRFGETIKFFSFNYGQTVDHIEQFIQENAARLAHIYLVDITLPDAFMWKYADRICWVDHHASSIEHIAELEGTGLHLQRNYSKSAIDGKRVAACELCWQSFHDAPQPEFIRLAGRYDVWDHSSERVLELNAYVGLMFKNSDEAPPFLMSEFDALKTTAGVATACMVGREALKWRSRFSAIDSARYVRVRQLHMWNTEYADVPVAIINAPGLDSYYFDAVFQEHPELKMAIFFFYDFRSNNWTLSFRSLEKGFSSLDYMKEALPYVYGNEIISMGGHVESCGATVYEIEPFLSLFQ